MSREHIWPDGPPSHKDPVLDEALESILEHASDADRRRFCQVERLLETMPTSGDVTRLLRRFESRALRYWCQDALRRHTA